MLLSYKMAVILKKIRYCSANFVLIMNMLNKFMKKMTVLKVVFVLHATTTGDRQSDEFDTNLRALKTFQIEILSP